MTQEETLQEKYIRAGKIIVRAGILPFAVSETLVELLKYYLDEGDIDFISSNFSGEVSLSMDQLKEKSGLTEGEIEERTGKLARKGFFINQPNTKGVMIYRLLPLVMVGTFEYAFMKKLPEGDLPEGHKKVARLYEKLLDELTEGIQEKYDGLLPFFEKQPPVDRTIPVLTTGSGAPIKIVVGETLKTVEQVLPAQTVEEIINKFDDIAVGHCFCRNYNTVLGHACEFNSPSEVCFSFGKSARHTIAQGFARPVTREEAHAILKKAEDAGLIHKAFHNGMNISKEENSICNCCKDCCDTFALWRKGAIPLVNSTNYLSLIDEGACGGCGTCVERCPVDAIRLNDSGRAVREESYCIGCGVCARLCPDGAISLREGMRRVYVPPPRLRP